MVLAAGMFASYLPVTLALPVTLESGPLPLDYSTCPLRGTGQCRLRALHYYEVYCIRTASFSRRYQTFAKLPSSKVNSGWTWTRAIWIFCLSIIQFSKDNPSFKTSLHKTFRRKLNCWLSAASLEMKCVVLCDICHQIVSIIV